MATEADFASFLRNRTFALSEGSIYERLRRDPSVKFDDAIYHGGLIYVPAFPEGLERVHRE